MNVLSESRNNHPVSEREKRGLGQPFEDTASKNQPARGSRIGLWEKRIVVNLLGLSTDISSAGFHAPTLFATAVGSSATWQEHPPLVLTWLKLEDNNGRKKLADLKAKLFNPNTKQERVERALKLLSNIKPIEGIDKATWKSIVEETALEDTYGD